MKLLVLFAIIASTVISKPVDEEAVVDVVRSTSGQYKYSFKSKNITIFEESDDNGVSGEYTYIDEDGQRQSVYYTSGVNGFVAAGTTIPVDIPEVVQARKVHLAISENLRSILPPLKEDEIAAEEDIVPLSKDQLLKAVETVAIGEDTDDVLQAKRAFLNLYKSALTR